MKKKHLKSVPNKSPKSVTHVTKGSVFDDLGLSAEEAAIEKYKFQLHHHIMKIIRSLKIDQHELSKLLDEPQSRISELVTGKLSKLGVKKLLIYLDKLGWHVPIKVTKKAG